ncbi:energy-coupling factor ABC transporter ATP-binding protein [Pallidibacillus pasinlerensis]|uniref:Energy-coupling factor transporter ATP-binding protein EcfA2 n=1 Tax=Pallidibacillus pasinlerensis TaxID=2703818 RepID=A0ABX0A7U4_9BACI|nr:energy-coupling factor ABC transporter ATP-binding protein [Pallidibacillus pasinlerensis]NCU18119.1 energy-coupling factor ABC transporter ATP-binding protein [Pallidibacillus pasinlerensis]
MEIKTKHLEYVYQKNSPFEKRALYNINITIPENSYTAIIGHTGSGKSTLLQHFNGLLQPTSGEIQIGDLVIGSEKKKKGLKSIRKKVGIVFQFPEHQLFEETVEKDICFGPMNFGLSEEEAKIRAKKALKQVGLNEEFLQKSPFDLSGGQMRRIAIAGVLAMKPEVLVLDEPTAGLDPRGRTEIMDMFYSLYKQHGISIVLVTHSMEDASKYADHIIVMHKGTVYKYGTPREIFDSPEELIKLGLDVPESIRFQLKLEEKIGAQIGKQPSISINELTDNILSYLKRGDIQ